MGFNFFCSIVFPVAVGSVSDLVPRVQPPPAIRTDRYFCFLPRYFCFFPHSGPQYTSSMSFCLAYDHYVNSPLSGISLHGYFLPLSHPLWTFPDLVFFFRRFVVSPLHCFFPFFFFLAPLRAQLVVFCFSAFSLFPFFVRSLFVVSWRGSSCSFPPSGRLRPPSGSPFAPFLVFLILSHTFVFSHTFLLYVALPRFALSLFVFFSPPLSFRSSFLPLLSSPFGIRAFFWCFPSYLV